MVEAKMEIVFTRHALIRMKERKVSKKDIFEVITYPEIVSKKHKKYYFRKRLLHGNIEVCCERIETNIKIITIYRI